MSEFFFFALAFLEVFSAIEFFKMFYDRRPFFARSWTTLVPIILAGAGIIYAVHLVEIKPLNLLACVIACYGACAAIYKIDVKSLHYIFLLTVINVLIEALVVAAFQLEAGRFNARYPGVDVTKVFFEGPLTTAVIGILIYTPVLFARQFVKRNTVKMKNSTFLMYMFMPVLNVMNLLLLPTFGLDIFRDGISQLLFNVYIIVLFCVTYLMFFTFQRHLDEIQFNIDLQDEKYNSERENDLLRVSTKALKTRLATVEDAMEKERILRHDRRHFENTIYSLLNNGDGQSIEQAKILLEEKIAAEPQHLRKWCDNEIVNATIEYYVSLAEKNDVKVEASLCVPKEINVDSLQLSLALGNLLENAIHANQLVPQEERFLKIKSLYKKQLLFQIENACTPDVTLDENDRPVSNKEGHGIGTKSVLAFAAQTNSVVIYSVKDCVFMVRMII